MEMMIGRYKLWSEKENNMLKRLWEKHIRFYGARWHGSLHYRISRDMRKWGYDRSEKAVARRCFRLGLKAYKVNQGEEFYKCADCETAFITLKKFAERKYHKKIYCFECAKKHKHDWDKKHRKEVLQYHKTYNKSYREKRRNQQIERRRKKNG